MTMSPVKAARWAKITGHEPYSSERGHYHAHPLLAAQRFVAERFACEELLKNDGAVVVDVGAAPHRSWRWLGDRGWFMMPNAVPGDASRISRVPPGARGRVCHHRFEECTCIGGPAALLFVHSAYYIEPMTLWRKLNDDSVVDCIVVEHTFEDMAGGFYDEAEWHLDGKLVHMSVKGEGQTPYVHRLQPWLSGWRGEGGEAFHAEVLAVWDDVTRVVRITSVVDMRPRNETLRWGEVSASDNLSGPVQFSEGTRMSNADNAKLGLLTLDLDRVYKMGPLLYTTSVINGVETKLVVPVNGVATAAMHIAMRERTPAAFQELLHITKNRYARSRIPSHTLGKVVSAVATLAFIIDLDDEMSLLNTVVMRHGWRLSVHSKLLGFGTVVRRVWPWAVLCSVLSLAFVVLLDVFDDHTTVDIVTTLVVLTALILGLLVVWYIVPMATTWSKWREQAWSSAVADAEAPRAPLLGNGFHITKQLPIPGSRHVRPPSAEVVGTIALGPSREAPVPKPGTLVSGVVLDGAMPTALHPSQDAEVSAVTNRVLLPRDNPTPDALLALQRHAFDDAHVPPGRVDYGLEAFRSWLASLSKKYPKAYVDNMEKLWHLHKGTVAVVQATKSFLKIEKSASTVKVDQAKAVKPRLIQPPSDESKAVLGPPVSQLQRMYVEHWDGRGHPVMYCSGYTNSEVGARVDDFIAKCGGEGNVVAWSMDMESYDTTLSLPVQLTAFKKYMKSGLTKESVSWLLATRPRGSTPNGVVYAPRRVWEFMPSETEQMDALVKLHFKYDFKVYKVEFDEEAGVWRVETEDFQMVSGRPDTNLTDSVILVETVTTVIDAHKVDYLLLVCGDDGFLMLHRDNVALFDEVRSFARSLGLKPTGSVSTKRSDWEFCSRLFFFGVNPKTNTEQTVLGPKPFRGMARMGTNTTLPGAQNAAAAALSVRVDAGHVPFLASFADRTYQLCAESRVKPTGRPEWSSFRPEQHRWGVSKRNYLITQERYGLGEEAEKELQGLLGNLDGVPIVLSWGPALDAIRVDEA